MGHRFGDPDDALRLRDDGKTVGMPAGVRVRRSVWVPAGPERRFDSHAD